MLDNRVISTGFNGTPAGFPNCRDGGCVRCAHRELKRRGQEDLATDPDLLEGPKQLDLCICVHAEQNALLSAARFGISADRATLYATHKPCFVCLKEAVQVGVKRVVYLYEWEPSKSQSLRQQYAFLSMHLAGEEHNFEQLQSQEELVNNTATSLRDPVLDHLIAKKEPSEPIVGEDETSDEELAMARAVVAGVSDDEPAQTETP